MIITLDYKKSLDTTNKVLYSLWAIGVAVAGWLITVIIMLGLKDLKATAPLVGAFAILISAGIASASLMKSIHTTKINDIEKAEKEKERKRIFALNVMKTIHVMLTAFSKKAESKYHATIGLRDFRSPIDFDSDIQTTGKLLNSVFCESILPYLLDEEQTIVSDFYREYYQFLATYTNDDSSPSLAVLTKRRPPMKLHQYLALFTAFAQSYIDLNAHINKEKNA